MSNESPSSAQKQFARSDEADTAPEDKEEVAGAAPDLPDKGEPRPAATPYGIIDDNPLC